MLPPTLLPLTLLPLLLRPVPFMLLLLLPFLLPLLLLLLLGSYGLKVEAALFRLLGGAFAARTAASSSSSAYARGWEGWGE